MRVDWCSRAFGEQVIEQQRPGWDRLFACWDRSHEPDEPHFHLAANRLEDWNRSFRAMGNGYASCAVRAGDGPLRMAAPGVYR